MKRTASVMSIASALFLLFAFAVSAQASVRPVRFIFSHNEPVTSSQSVGLEEWAAVVEKAADGRISFEMLGGGALGAARDTLDRVRHGAADFTYTTPSLFEGMFPYVQMFQLPMLPIRDGNVGTNALWDLYDEFPEVFDNMFESQGLKLIGMFCTDSSIIGTNVEVRTVDDIRGMRLRAVAGPLSEVTRLWGASPISLGQSEIYEAMEKNLIEGMLNVWSGVYSFRQYEVARYFLDIPIFCNQLMVVMGLDQWNALSPELQEILWENSGREASLKYFYAGQAQNTVQAREAIVAHGSVINVATPEEIATFAGAAEAVNRTWLERYTTDEVDAIMLFERAKELISNY